jgi:hypothetical protein
MPGFACQRAAALINITAHRTGSNDAMYACEADATRSLSDRHVASGLCCPASVAHRAQWTHNNPSDDAEANGDFMTPFWFFFITAAPTTCGRTSLGVA